jgi:hypothetical protein
MVVTDVVVTDVVIADVVVAGAASSLEDCDDIAAAYHLKRNPLLNTMYSDIHKH